MKPLDLALSSIAAHAAARAHAPPCRAAAGAGRGALATVASLFTASLAATPLAAGACVQRAVEHRLHDRPPPGLVSRRQLTDDVLQTYFVYVPRRITPGAPLVVSMHGISRNADEHARRLAPLAERYGAVLVAPLFDAARFPDYQRLGRDILASGPRGARADLMLERIVAEVARTTPADPARLYLFGFSGGGQFAHRFAMAYPDRVAAYAVGAAGWYTFPDATVAFPRGTRVKRCLSGVCLDPERYLRVPALVLVGERDIHEGTALRATAAVVAQQGESRLERGAHWVAAMQSAARGRGFDTRFEFATLARSSHSFTAAVRRGRLGERVFEWFFGASAPAADATAGKPQRRWQRGQ